MTDKDISSKEYGKSPKSTRRKKKKAITESEALVKLWEAGYLQWKLRGKQMDIYRHFTETDHDISTCLISRQFGKSFTLCLIAVEFCIKNPGSIIKYACPTQKMVERIIKPRIKEIIQDCPDHLKPEWKTQEKEWVFPNGSSIQVAGCNGERYDALRGGSSHMCIVDEAAFVDELETVVFSVLAPTTDTTDGRIFLSSTPNDKDANHEFHENFVFPHEATGKLLKMTWEDSPMITDKKRERILSRYPGGADNIKFRCEYLCEIPSVTEATVVPEFQKVKDDIVKEIEKPEYCDFYTSMDIGYSDLTVVLFGYYDYYKKTLVILDEEIFNGSAELKTHVVSQRVKNAEKKRFIVRRHEQEEYQEPYLRYSDNNNLILLNDLASTYDLLFHPTEKRNKEQYVDLVRRWVEQKRIIIHPRCVNLLYHISKAQWHYTKAGTFTGKFKNLKGDDKGGLLSSHADALDALIYMARNVQTNRNPYPKDYGLKITENTFVSNKWRAKNKSKAVEFMKKVMNIKEN